MEKLLNLKIYYNTQNYYIADDYFNIIKIISLNIVLFLQLNLFRQDINIFNISFKKDMNIDEKLNYFIDIIYLLLSQSIIKKYENKKYLLDLFKEYIFPFLIEVSYFFSRTNNLDGYKNIIKLFELLLNELDDGCVENLKIEIYIFTEKIIMPYFSKDVTNINDSSEYLKYLSIKSYLMEILNSNLINYFFELHINYDSHIYFNNIFINIIKNVTNISYNNDESNPDNEIIHKIKNLSLNFINKTIIQIEDFANNLISKKGDENNNKINDTKINQYIKLKNILEEGLEKFYINPSSVINFLIKNNVIPEAKDFIIYKEEYIKNSMYISENQINNIKDSNKEKRYKYNLPYFPLLFKDKNNIFDEKDINNLFNEFFSKYFSLSLNYDDFTAYILAFFIKFNFDKIMSNNKLLISNFFSSFSSLAIKVLYYYINNFNFKNYNLLEALHLIFNYLPLINKKQIIEKVISIFANKYIIDNFPIDDSNISNYLNDYIVKLSQMIIDISYSIANESDIQNQINKKLKPINIYLSNFKKDFEYNKNIVKLEIMNYSYIFEIYNLALSNPLNFYSYPNKNSLIDSNGIIKSNNHLYGVFPSELFIIQILNNINNNNDNIYILRKNMNVESLKNIINNSWEFFLCFYSKHIVYYNDKENITNGINNILTMGKICGMIELYTISDAFINSIINITGLNESLYKKLNYKNVLALKSLITFIHENGKYIYSSWYPILCILSRINQLKKINGEILYNLLKLKKFDKDTFIEIFVENANQVELIDNINIDNITKDFNSKILKQFILDLNKVIEDEIKLFEDNKKIKERLFSFNILAYIVKINKEKWKNNEDKEIYQIIKDFYIKLISENPMDDILLNKIKDSFKIIDKDKK